MEHSPVLARILRELRLGRPASADLPLPAAPIPLASQLAVGELAWTSVVAAGAAICPGGFHAPEPDAVAAAYQSDRHLRIDGEAPQVWSALSGFWRTRDGWVRTHANYPHHTAALRSGLGLPGGSEAEDVGARISTMTSRTVVESIRADGGVCVEVLHEDPGVDADLHRHPLVELSSGPESAPRPLPAPTARAPLAGIRVLDLTRVIAGPVATRTLAFAGADVLRIDPPRLPEFAWQHFDTGAGKRSALLDIAAEPALFAGLIAEADVLVLGYRPGALRRLGLSPRTLMRRHPHLVIAQLSAWPGPGSGRGFDSIVQAQSGISWVESPDGARPGALPAQALDHSAGYLLAAGVASALRQRAEHGGSWLVRTSLRRIAAELLGMPRPGAGAEPSADAERRAPVRTQTHDVAGRKVTTVAPAVTWPGAPTEFPAPRPWGADQPRW